MPFREQVDYLFAPRRRSSPSQLGWKSRTRGNYFQSKNIAHFESLILLKALFSSNSTTLEDCSKHSIVPSFHIMDEEDLVFLFSIIGLFQYFPHEEATYIFRIMQSKTTLTSPIFQYWHSQSPCYQGIFEKMLIFQWYDVNSFKSHLSISFLYDTAFLCTKNVSWWRLVFNSTRIFVGLWPLSLIDHFLGHVLESMVTSMPTKVSKKYQ